MNVSRTPLPCALILLLLGIVCAARGQSFRKTYTPQGSIARDLVETPGVGFFMAGGTTDSVLFLQRTDAAGAILWTKHQALSGAQAVAVCRAVGGGFAVLCENFRDGGILRSAVLKIDDNGETEWLKILENYSLPNGFTDIVATSDGGFALVGEGRVLTPSADFYVRLLKLDASGVLLWEKTFGQSNTTTELGRRLTELPNGDLALAGEIRGNAPPVENGADFWLARTDAQGNILWQNTYPKPAYQRIRDFLTAPDGSLVILGETVQTAPLKLTLLKTNGAGAEIWYRQPISLLEDSPLLSGSLVNCFTRDNAGNLYIPVLYENTGISTDLALLKLDAAGDSVWMKNFGLDDFFQAAVFTSDDHFAFCGTSNFAWPDLAVLVKTDGVALNPGFANILSGTVYRDENANCTRDTGESAPPLLYVEARDPLGETRVRPVGPGGHYTIPVSAGNYDIYVRTLSGAPPLWNVCDTPAVSVAGFNQTVQVPPIGVQSAGACPYLEVDLTAGALRRCTTSNWHISYCNYGSLAATGASVQVSVDPLLSYVSSSIPLSAQAGGLYTFNIADVPPGDCGSFWVKFLLSCDAVQGQGICAEAHIFPDSLCTPPDSAWDGSHLELTAGCNGGVQFTVSNTGAGMTGPCDYVIIEDQIMYQMGHLQLSAGADTAIAIPNPAGSSYYMRIDQRPGHPGAGQPSAVADHCNGPTAASLSLQLPLDDADPFIDIHCDAVVGSFDPNDKRGFPLGWRNQHFIEANRDIEYLIRFQNTGNDTAFHVVIRDQLPPQLEPLSVRPGAASHPYRFEMTANNSLSFTFSDILLPDSTTNEPESHGFVSFTVAQKPDLSQGTIIENEAAIYFDFNEPVVTEPYFHTIGRPLLNFTIDRPANPTLNLSIAPNPAAEQAIFRFDDLATGSRLHLRLFDALGRPLRTERFSGPEHIFRRDGLPSGLYFFRVETENGRVASGKLMLR